MRGPSLKIRPSRHALQRFMERAPEPSEIRAEVEGE